MFISDSDVTQDIVCIFIWTSVSSTYLFTDKQTNSNINEFDWFLVEKEQIKSVFKNIFLSQRKKYPKL